MTKKKPSTIGKDLRNFERVGGNPQKTYLGERPGAPDPKVARAIAKRAARASGKITAELRLYAEAFADKKNHTDAWMALHPSCTNRDSARRQGYGAMKKIRETLSESEIYDLLGLSREAITTAIADALGATSQRDFIVARTGQIVSTPPVPAHDTRLAAAALGVKVRRMIPDEVKGTGPVTIQIVSYLQGPVAEQRPWPNGGRVIDGRLQDVVGPNSPAACGALPPGTVTVDFGPKSERDD